MSRKLPYANTNPVLELAKMTNILEKKRFAAQTGHSRRRVSPRLTDEQRAEIPCYKRKAEHFPLYMMRASAAKTIDQRLKEAGVKGIRPADTYRGRVRNYRMKRGEFAQR